MRQTTFLAVLMTLALLLLLGSMGCSSRRAKTYSDQRCEVAMEYLGFGKPKGMSNEQWEYETKNICTGGLIYVNE